MKTIKNTFIATALTLLLVGCGGGGGDDWWDDDPGDGGGYGTSYLQVGNSASSDSNICNVYSNPSSSSTWGPDRLSGTISPGFYREFSTDNCNILYDLKVVFCDGYEDAVYSYYRGCGDTVSYTFRNW